mgnify:CR=1 FL=1
MIDGLWRGFASDNYAGIHPEIFAAIASANTAHQTAYGDDATTAALVALTINLGAYTSEIVRAGIENTPRGQFEAARSLAMTEFQVFTRVVLPPALGRVWPALTSQIVIVMLGSAVRSYLNRFAVVPGTRAVVFTSSDDGWTTARDLALLGLALVRDFPQYYPYFQTREFMLGKQKIGPGVKFVELYAPYADGMKTDAMKPEAIAMIVAKLCRQLRTTLRQASLVSCTSMLLVKAIWLTNQVVDVEDRVRVILRLRRVVANPGLVSRLERVDDRHDADEGPLFSFEFHGVLIFHGGALEHLARHRQEFRLDAQVVLLRNPVADAVVGDVLGTAVILAAMDAAEDAGPPPAWVLDPIDGTHNFLRGVPVWASLIACSLDGVPTVGVISAPALGTRWWAARGLGAFRRDRLTGIEERLHGLGYKPLRREGEQEGRWVLLDFGDLVVHVQLAEERIHYAIERLWKDFGAPAGAEVHEVQVGRKLP